MISQVLFFLLQRYLANFTNTFQLGSLVISFCNVERVPEILDEYNKFLKYIRPGIVSIIRKIEQPTITKIIEQFNQTLQVCKEE